MLATDPEMVGFSATTSGFIDAVDMAACIKREQPGIRIVFGNVHVSSARRTDPGILPRDRFSGHRRRRRRHARPRRRASPRVHPQPGVPGRRRQHRQQPAPGAHPRSGRAALPRLRETRRFPPRLPPAAVRLREAARRDHDHLARLPLHLLLLRPHGVRAAVQDQFRPLHLRAHEVPAGPLRRLPHQLLRRSVLPPTAGASPNCANCSSTSRWACSSTARSAPATPRTRCCGSSSAPVR
ncbi:MAG: hypothetical protein MZW92_43265 [Comamonadaceae bacterium]|nr:hypothetical protein [Comamonadaceae bacterium]